MLQDFSVDYTKLYLFSEFVIPTSLIIYTNIMIVHLSKDKGRAGTKEATQEATVNKKILKAMMLVIFFYVILNFPAAAIRISKGIFPDISFPDFTTSFFQVGQFMASVVNPLIYGLFRADFQSAFIKVKKDLVKLLKGEA